MIAKVGDSAGRLRQCRPIGAVPHHGLPSGLGDGRRFWDDRTEVEARRNDDEPEALIYFLIVRGVLDRYLRTDDTVLDIGGGPGRFSLAIAPRVSAVTHLDYSQRMLASARRRSESLGLRNLTFVSGDARRLTGFADRSFSVSLAINGAVTFSAQAWRSAVTEACRVADRLVVLTVASFVSAVPAVLAGVLSAGGSLESLMDHTVDQGMFDGDAATRFGITFPSYRAVLPEELAGPRGGRVRRRGAVWRCLAVPVPARGPASQGHRRSGPARAVPAPRAALLAQGGPQSAGSGMACGRAASRRHPTLVW